MVFQEVGAGGVKKSFAGQLDSRSVSSFVVPEKEMVFKTPVNLKRTVVLK